MIDLLYLHNILLALNFCSDGALQQACHLSFLGSQQLPKSFGGMSEDDENEITESLELGGVCPIVSPDDCKAGGKVGGYWEVGSITPLAAVTMLNVRAKAAIRS